MPGAISRYEIRELGAEAVQQALDKATPPDALLPTERRAVSLGTVVHLRRGALSSVLPAKKSSRTTMSACCLASDPVLARITPKWARPKFGGCDCAKSDEADLLLQRKVANLVMSKLSDVMVTHKKVVLRLLSVGIMLAGAILIQLLRWV